MATLVACATILPPWSDESEPVSREEPSYVVLPPVRYAFAVSELVPTPDFDAPTRDLAGWMGDRGAAEVGGRYAVAGPANNVDPHISRFDYAGETQWDGVPGMAFSGATQRASTAPWGREDALGTEPLTTLGAVWGATMGASRGDEGLGVRAADDAGQGMPALGGAAVVHGERGYRCRMP